MSPSRRLKNYIRSARKEAGLTQKELAYLLGGQEGKLISRYEHFERMPKLPLALACQIALGIPMDDLFAGIYKEVQEIVVRRARVWELQLRRMPNSRAIQRKRETIRRIIESADDGNALRPS